MESFYKKMKNGDYDLEYYSWEHGENKIGIHYEKLKEDLKRKNVDINTFIIYSKEKDKGTKGGDGINGICSSYRW